MSFLLDPSHSDALREKFHAELAPVSVRVEVHPTQCAECDRAEAIVNELKALSPKIRVDRRQSDGTRPALTLEGKALGGVSFIGLPTGYEFPTFIDALFDVGSGATATSLEARQRLQSLTERVHVQVFTTPT